MSEKRSINPIEKESLEKIIAKSPQALPLRPSEAGMSADEIRKRFYAFITDSDDSVLAEIDRIIRESNEVVAPLYAFMDLFKGTDSFETESKDIVGAINELHGEGLDLLYKLFGDGKIGTKISPDALPSYVDDVLEYDNFNAFPREGEVGKIYIDVQSNKSYRWSASNGRYLVVGGGDIPIEPGVGGKSMVINEGNALGASSIAGGTTDTELIKSVLGGGYAELIEKYGDISKMSDTVLNILLSAADVGYTLEEFKRILAISPATAEGLLAISLGASNKSQSAVGISLGFGNISGAKGYYFDIISPEDKIIKLAPNQDGGGTVHERDWKAGDRLFIVNGDRYFAEIESVTIISKEDTRVTLKEMPFTELAELKTVTIPLDKTYNITNPSERSVINLDKPESGEVELGWGAIAIGALNTILGSNAFGVGYKHLIAGDFGATFGQENKVGYSAFAAGIRNKALGKASFTSGEENEASGRAANATGKGNVASGDYAQSSGYETTASGWASCTKGHKTKASGTDAYAEGYLTTAEGERAHAEGKESEAIGEASHAENEGTYAEGKGSHAQGHYSKSMGDYSDASGYKTTAVGKYSRSAGESTNRFTDAGVDGGSNVNEIIAAWKKAKFSAAKGRSSHVGGKDCLALGDYSFADGECTKAKGGHSRSTGLWTEANGKHSYAGGDSSKALHDDSFVHGRKLSTSRDGQAVFGINNVDNEDALLIVGGDNYDGGNGSNAFEVIEKDGAFAIKVGNTEITENQLRQLIGLLPGTSIGHFTVSHRSSTSEYDFVIGMTWGDFLDSEYNRSGFYVDDGEVRVSDGCPIADENFECVMNTDKIIDGWSYVASH